MFRVWGLEVLGDEGCNEALALGNRSRAYEDICAAGG